MTVYRNRRAVLATKHDKEHAIRRPLRAAVGLEVVVPPGLDTDLLGTFSGEVERDGAPSEVVVRKARLGMAAAGLPLGLASEGSFRSNADLSFAAGGHEMIAFVDDEAGIEIVEDFFTADTNFANIKARGPGELEDFLRRAGFPEHALIVVPNDRIALGADDRVRLALDRVSGQQVFKGIADRAALAQAVERCASLSQDDLAHIETDMRAHLNPTRMRAIRHLAFRLGRRLATPCPACRAPGWGAVSAERGLPCAACRTPTPLPLAVILGCTACGHRAAGEPANGHLAPPAVCPSCRDTGGERHRVLRSQV